MRYYGFDASSYLEHYGVKGMKWGIRKEYEPVGNDSRHSGPNSVSHLTDHIVMNNKRAKLAKELFYDNARNYVSAKTNGNVNDADEKLWDEAYKSVAEDLSEDVKISLMLYEALEQNNLTYRFSVFKTFKDSGVKYQFYDNFKKEAVSSLSECKRRAQIDKFGTRNKKVDSNAKAVKVQKGKKHYGATAGANFEVASVLASIPKEKIASDKLSDRGSKTQASKKDQNLWSAKKSRKKYDFIWNK